jgi:hypothetical protein
MRPHKTKTPLRVILDAGHNLKEISERSGIPYNTLRAISSKRGLKLSHSRAKKIAEAFPIVTVDYLLGMCELPGAQLPSEYENQSTAIVKTTTPMTPAVFDDAALKALQQSARFMEYALPTDPVILSCIAHFTWLGGRAVSNNPRAAKPWTYLGLGIVNGKLDWLSAESKFLLSDEDQAAIKVIFDMSKRWLLLSDRKAPKYTSQMTDRTKLIGTRLNLFQYWSYLRAQYLPKEEMQARPDLMAAFEALLLNAQSQLTKTVEGPRGPEPRNDSYLVANEVMAFIRATRKKYTIWPDFSFMQKRLIDLEQPLGTLTYKALPPERQFNTKGKAKADSKSRKMFAARLGVELEKEKARVAAAAAAKSLVME